MNEIKLLQKERWQKKFTNFLTNQSQIMKNQTPKKLTNSALKIFEQSRKIDENGNEFWTARDLAKILEYSEYRHFLPVITKAQESCQNSAHKA